MNKQYKKVSSNKLWLVGIVIVLISLSIWSYYYSRESVTVFNDPKVLPGIQTNEAPWPAEISKLRARLNAIDLPALTAEGSALHIHQHLDLFIDGKQVPIPENIGVNEAGGFISDIHTHDGTGVIHVESPTIQTFTLGQFFDIWGVQFTNQSIGGYIAKEDKILKVFVNGVQYTGDLRQLALDAHQEIFVAYGTDQELPSPIPVSYEFTKGL